MVYIDSENEIADHLRTEESLTKFKITKPWGNKEEREHTHQDKGCVWHILSEVEHKRKKKGYSLSSSVHYHAWSLSQNYKAKEINKKNTMVKRSN